MFSNKFAFYLAIFFFLIDLHADVREEMLKFLDEVSSSSNVSSAEIYQGQKAGYVTGGGFTLRNKSSTLNPVSVTLPRFDAGCGGIGGLGSNGTENRLKG